VMWSHSVYSLDPERRGVCNDAFVYWIRGDLSDIRMLSSIPFPQTEMYAMLHRRIKAWGTGWLDDLFCQRCLDLIYRRSNSIIHSFIQYQQCLYLFNWHCASALISLFNFHVIVDIADGKPGLDFFFSLNILSHVYRPV